MSRETRSRFQVYNRLQARNLNVFSKTPQIEYLRTLKGLVKSDNSSEILL
jgi:hypothetical protein